MSNIQCGGLVVALTIDTVLIIIVIASWGFAILAAVKDRKP